MKQLLASLAACMTPEQSALTTTLEKHLGRHLVHDNRYMGRRITRDSTLSYYVNQLENLDRRLYEPLVAVSWGRDIKLRPGITMSDESTSFIRSAFAGAGTLDNPSSPTGGGNMPWISSETNDIPGVSVNGQHIVLPLRLAAREVSYTSVELNRSQQTGQPIDVQKLNALNLLYNMNVDQMVYVGSSDVGATGLLNNASITTSIVAMGATGGTTWATKTADEILADVNSLLEQTWAASAYAICPSELRLPPFQYSYISSQKVSSAGNVSILKFLKENSIALDVNGKELNIQPVKWLPGIGTGGDDRMVAYTNDEGRVRYPMVPIRRETAYYRGIRFFAPYIWALGELEFVYPETVMYADGI
jgi:hypothetical protein